MTIRVLIVELPALMRRTLSTRLSVESDIDVVGEADDVSLAARLICELDPHVILLDTEMPGLDVREAVETLRAQNGSRRIVVLTLDPRALVQVLGTESAVAVGKHDGPAALVGAIRTAAATREDH
jgi:DNA-binding NarL/FixJ family response regulator